MKGVLNTSPKPSPSGLQGTINYSRVPAGLCISGQMWTGQAATFTEVCPKCRRVGLVSTILNDKRVMVHRGRIIGNALEGIDYCELSIPTHRKAHDDSHAKESGRLDETTPNKQRKDFLATILKKFSRPFTRRFKWITHM